MDEHRDFVLIQGMKKPAYKRIPVRVLLDEIEYSGCDLQRDYLRRVIDAMDREYLKYKNKAAN